MKRIPSPNYNERAEKTLLAYVVLHYTGMRTAAEALDRLRDPHSEVSCHYMIDEEGGVIQMVEEDHRAWHAGHSCWRGKRDINSQSIGIELVNKGHAFGYTPFPKAQIDSLKALLHDIKSRYSLSPESLLAHSDIAPLRKEDPGELFPWQELAAVGLSLWPSPTPEDRRPALLDEIATMLGEIGYEVRTPESLEAAQRAFLRRYHPERLEDGFDDETTARLRALERILNPLL
ncbi:MAG: N-acetylmuramoyl-L-alanine amidase [Bdellovibrionales bacterium]|jgi:N-acetylmuramoyl-L-alanine amidase